MRKGRVIKMLKQMNIKIIKQIFLLITIFLAVIINCTINVANNGGTDYPNTKTLAGVVYSSSNEPVSNAKIRIVESNDWIFNILNGKSVILDSTVTSEIGTFKIKKPNSEHWNIQIDAANEGILLNDFSSQYDSTKDTSYTFTLKPYSKISGNILAENGIVKALMLSGSAYFSSLNPNNSYSFPKVAEGIYTIISQIDIFGNITNSVCGSVKLANGISVLENNLTTSVSNVLIDDFSSEVFTTNIGKLIGGGWWYTVNDSLENGKSTINISFISEPDAYKGKSLKATYYLDPNKIGPWAIMGFFIGKDSTNYDLSELKSLSFWIKGNGTIELRFYSKEIEQINGNSYQLFRYSFAIPNNWTHVTIPVDSLKLPTNCNAYRLGYTWQQAAKLMQIVYFIAYSPLNNAGDTVNLYLDDVVFEGMKLENLIK